MSRVSKATLAAFVAATLAGSCLHFLYLLLPNVLTALLAPVNESLWEHLKILYWPCLVAGLLLLRREGNNLGERAFALLLAAAAMEGVAWLYHGVLGGHSLLFDVVLYVVCMGLFFLLPAFLQGTFWKDTRKLWAALAVLLGVLIVVFTWLPPDNMLFQEFLQTGENCALPGQL